MAEELFALFKRVKEREKITTFDTHIHPYDVLDIGVKLRANANKKFAPSLLERLQFSNTAVRVLHSLFYLSPHYIKKSIVDNYEYFDVDALHSEMERAGMDVGVLLPVEPFVAVKNLKDFKGKQFLSLGSLDIHNIATEDIENIVNEQIKTLHIKGIKLHPNIQAFFPYPEKNNKKINQNLSEIYGVAIRKKLYLLFHSGVSYLFNQERVKFDNAVLENFVNSAGRSTIFELDIPIILAHGGSYNITHPNLSLLNSIARNYKNVFFDTAGLSPHLLAKIIQTVGIDRAVFGSDANYFNMRHSVKLVLKALALVNSGETLDEKIIKVFSSNYQQNILRFGQ